MDWAITNGIRSTPVSVLSVRAGVQLNLGKFQYGGANLSAESRQILFGGHTFARVLSLYRGVYETSP